MPTHPYYPPPRGKLLAKFGTASAHSTQPGGSDIYPPNGWVPERRELSMNPPQPHDLPPRGEPLEKIGPHPTHTIPPMGGSLAKVCTQGGVNPIPPHPEFTRGGGGVAQPTAQGEGGLEARPWGPTHPPP